MNELTATQHNPYRSLMCAVISMACKDYLKYYGTQRHADFVSAQIFLFEDGLRHYCGLLNLDRKYLLDNLEAMATQGKRRFDGPTGKGNYERG